MCVLGAINESYKALCDVRKYVCMCLKLSANYGQTIRVFVFFHKKEWVYKILRILNLEEQLNCMICSKVTALLPPFFQKKLKTSNIGMWGCLSRGNWLIYCDVHSYLILVECSWRKSTFSLKCFWDPTSDLLDKN